MSVLAVTSNWPYNQHKYRPGDKKPLPGNPERPNSIFVYESPRGLMA